MPAPARIAEKHCGQCWRPGGFCFRTKGVRPNSPVTTSERVGQHAALFEVGKQCGQRLIQTRQTESHAVRAIAEGVAHAHVSAVHVPTAARRACLVMLGLPGPAVDGDKTTARFHHPSCEQQILPERMHPIALANLVGFAVQFERLPAFGPRHGVVSLLAQVGPVLDKPELIEPGGLEPAEQQLARVESFLIVGVINPRRLEVAHGRMVVCRADKHGRVCRAKVAADAQVGRAKDRGAYAFDGPRVGNEIAFAGFAFGDE